MPGNGYQAVHIDLRGGAVRPRQSPIPMARHRPSRALGRRRTLEVAFDADELEDDRSELANHRRAVLSVIFSVARSRCRVGVDPMDGFEPPRITDKGPHL